MKTKAMAGIALSGVLAVMACGSPQEDVEGESLEWDETAREYVMEDEIASGDAPLTVWFSEDDLAEAVIEAFNEEYPDVRVEFETVALADAIDNMALAGEAGRGADVYMTMYDRLPSAIEDGTAAPLGEYDSVLRDRIDETFIDVVSQEDSMYAVPVATESIALVYNRSLLEELVGSGEPAQTWEEIMDLAEEYNDPSTNRWAIRFLAGEIYYAYPVLASLGWHLYPDGELDDPGFADEQLVAGLEYYSELRDIWNVPTADADWETVEDEFAQGETPYVITGPWSFASFDEGAREHDFDYGVTTIPQVEGGAEAATLAGMQVGVVSGYTEYPAAARVFANFLASDAGAAALYESRGMVPALEPELHTNIEGLSEDELVEGIVSQSQQADLVPMIPPYFWETSNSMIEEVWDGLTEVDVAVERAREGYEELHGLR